MAHDHAHPHGPATGGSANQRRLGIALLLAASYAGAEVVGGLWTGSLALLADAGHMLTDVFALSMSYMALRIAQRPATPQRTYGYRRTEILAAFGQGVLLVCVSVFVLSEALERWSQPREVLGGPMLLIAAGGLAVNIAGLATLHGGRENLNIRGAWLHVLSDAFGSVGAMTAGALIWAFGWMWADPVASVVIAGLIVYSSIALLRESLHVLMEGAPEHIDVTEVERAVTAVDGVVAVHDLHVWTITSGMVSLSGHVLAKDGVRHGALLQEVCDLLHQRFDIAHATIQIEDSSFSEPGEICRNEPS